MNKNVKKRRVSNEQRLAEIRRRLYGPEYSAVQDYGNGGDVAMDSLQGAAKGALAGAAFVPPWGAIVGGAIGGIGGMAKSIMGDQKEQREQNNANWLAMQQNRLVDYNNMEGMGNQIPTFSGAFGGVLSDYYTGKSRPMHNSMYALGGDITKNSNLKAYGYNLMALGGDVNELNQRLDLGYKYFPNGGYVENPAWYTSNALSMEVGGMLPGVGAGLPNGTTMPAYKMAAGGPVVQAHNPGDADKDILFQDWYSKNTIEGKNNIPFSPKLDYDYYSYYKNNESKHNIFGDHFTDRYKRPGHPGFSNESIYSTPENPGGSWSGSDGETYNPKGKFLYGAGGHLPEGNATLAEAREFQKLYPKEMAFGIETEYEHTGNEKLAMRIAADHIKDSIKLNQGAPPDYYTKLQAIGISDELNKLPNMQEMARGGFLSKGKATEMLKDGKIHGKPITARQRKYFEAIAHGWTPDKKMMGGGPMDFAEGGSLPFGQAYKEARSAGLKEFEWKGNKYGTISAEEAIAQGLPQWVYADKPNYRGSKKVSPDKPIDAKEEQKVQEVAIKGPVTGPGILARPTPTSTPAPMVQTELPQSVLETNRVVNEGYSAYNNENKWPQFLANRKMQETMGADQYYSQAPTQESPVGQMPNQLTPGAPMGPFNEQMPVEQQQQYNGPTTGPGMLQRPDAPIYNAPEPGSMNATENVAQPRYPSMQQQAPTQQNIPQEQVAPIDTVGQAPITQPAPVQEPKKEITQETATRTVDPLEAIQNVIQLGGNALKRRKAKKSEALDPVSNIKTEMQPTDSQYDIRRYEQTGDTINYKGKNANTNQYYLPEVIDLNNVTLGARNRGDFTDVKSKAGVVTAFENFDPYEKYAKKDLPVDASFVGIDANGKIKVGGIKDFGPGDQMSKVFMNRVKDFNREPDGSIKFNKRNKDNPNFYVPEIVTVGPDGKEKIGSLNLLTKRGAFDANTYGDITGGRVILRAGGETKLVSGSVADIDKAFKKMRDSYGTVDVYALDNGTFNKAIRSKSGVISEDELRAYDSQNKRGGNFLYLKDENPKYKETFTQTPNIRTTEDESYKKGHGLINEKKAIVLHHTAEQDTAQTTSIKGFLNKGGNSAHVIIKKDGSRQVFANPDQVTFHAGESEFKGRENLNDFAIGVEFAGNTMQTRLTPSQIDSFVEYILPIIQKNNIPLENIASHKMVAPLRKPEDMNDIDYNNILDALKKRVYEKKAYGGPINYAMGGPMENIQPQDSVKGRIKNTIPKHWSIDDLRRIRKSDFQEWPDSADMGNVAGYMTDPAYGMMYGQPVADTMNDLVNRGSDDSYKYLEYLQRIGASPIPGQEGLKDFPYSDEFYKGLLHTKKDTVKNKATGGPMDPPAERIKGMGQEAKNWTKSWLTSPARQDVLRQNMGTAGLGTSDQSLLDQTSKQMLNMRNATVSMGDMNSYNPAEYDIPKNKINVSPHLGERGFDRGAAMQQVEGAVARTLGRDKYTPQEVATSAITNNPTRTQGDSNPADTYSNLMGFRMRAGITPDRIINDRDISQWRKSGMLQQSGLGQYDDATLMALFNQVAQNTGRKDAIPYAAMGGIIDKIPSTGAIQNPMSMSGSITKGTTNKPSLLTEYKGGGTHEQNPNGGIQVGEKARVEEGEFRFDNPKTGTSYIFSNRIPYRKR